MGCPSRPACFLVLPPGSRTLLTAIAWLCLHCLVLFSALWLVMFTASALRNLVSDSVQPPGPDLVLHH
ncbi:hypothetical protein P692DRAFT_201795259, partial [Suillus brevipes Sb2]